MQHFYSHLYYIQSTSEYMKQNISSSKPCKRSILKQTTIQYRIGTGTRTSVTGILPVSQNVWLQRERARSFVTKDPV